MPVSYSPGCHPAGSDCKPSVNARQSISSRPGTGGTRSCVCQAPVGPPGKSTYPCETEAPTSLSPGLAFCVVSLMHLMRSCQGTLTASSAATTRPSGRSTHMDERSECQYRPIRMTVHHRYVRTGPADPHSSYSACGSPDSASAGSSHNTPGALEAIWTICGKGVTMGVLE